MADFSWYNHESRVGRNSSEGEISVIAMAWLERMDRKRAQPKQSHRGQDARTVRDAVSKSGRVGWRAVWGRSGR